MQKHIKGIEWTSKRPKEKEEEKEKEEKEKKEN
jgi:hypothetical protein